MPEFFSNVSPEANIAAVPLDADVYCCRLSYAQERLWFLSQLQPKSSAYNIPFAIRVQGELNVQALKASFNAIVQRHEVLRTRFAVVDEEPMQLIAPQLCLPLPLVDLSGCSSSEQQALVPELLRAEFTQPFELGHRPLLRAKLLRLSATDHVLVTSMHHIISDGWSVGILMREMVALYQALSAHRPSPLHPVTIQYADYVVWQRQRLTGQVLEEQLAYWKRQLQGLPPALNLPTDHVRQPVQTFQGATQSFLFPVSLMEALQTLSRHEGVSLFMLLLAAFNVLLYRYTGQEAVAVGTPIANREQKEIEDVIGFFTNTLVLRTDLSGDPQFRALLARVRQAALGAFAHQDLPFAYLVQELRPQRDLGRNPFFQVMFALQNIDVPSIQIPGIVFTRLDIGGSAAQFDLTFHVWESPRGLAGTVEYDTTLFEAATISRMAEHFQVLLEAVVANPDSTISRLPILRTTERRQLLEAWNDTTIAYRPEATIPTLFGEQVTRTPDAIAVQCEGDALSYAKLQRQASGLARQLHAIGVRADVPVGIYLDRSLECIVALLAVLQAGGAYLPLDPTYPERRIEFMLEDAHAQLVITQPHLHSKLPKTSAQTIIISSQVPHDDASSDEALPAVAPDGLAYIIYTSGSTGVPKGVMVSHRSIANRLLWIQDLAPLSVADRLVQKTPLSFDVSAGEVFWPLVVGATLVVARPDGHKDIDYLVSLIQRDRVTTAHFVPSMLDLFLDQPNAANCHSLCRVYCSGEAMPVALQNRFFALFERTELLNLYGPTEAAVDVSAWICQQNDVHHTVPIGRPVPNTRLYVLDQHMEPVPIGVVGRLYIGGVQLARGYLSRPNLTAEKFTPDPFGTTPGCRLYDTGDLVRLGPDGAIEYLGRVDHQVKLRGFRIELEEIEVLLLKQEGIRAASVQLRGDDAGNPKLVAYLMGSEQMASDMQRLLRSQLPEFMVPSHFVWLPAFPLLPNGKLDVRALPAPESQFESRAEPVGPRNMVEEILAALWSQALGLSMVGVHDNFFEIGGHSLLATRLLGHIRERLGVEVPLRRIFECPTIATLAEAISRAQAGSGVCDTPPPIQPRPVGDIPPLSFSQQRLWFLDQLAPGQAFYNIPAAVELTGPLDRIALFQSLWKIAERHEVLRATIPVVDGQPVQSISSTVRLELPVIDLSALPEAERRQEAIRLATEEAQRSFDLSAGPLFRTALLILDDRLHVLLLTMHHIISDGWSIGIIVEELTHCYHAYCQRRPVELAELPVQYGDYAHWQRRWLQGEVLEHELAYWKRQLSPQSPPLALPTDRPRPAVQRFRGAVLTFLVAAQVTEGLRAMSQREGVTLFMTLLAGFQVLLYRHTGQKQVVVGTSIANRQRHELERLIGFFINALPLQVDFTGDPTFHELLGQVREVCLNAYVHQDLPFEMLVDALQVPRDLSYQPIFQVMFTLQNFPTATLELEGLVWRQWDVDNRTAKFDLELTVTEVGDHLNGALRYDTDLFDDATIARMITQFQTLLEHVVIDPSQRVADVALLPANEKQKLLCDWNDTDAGYAQDQLLHQLFEAQVERTPDRVALVYQDESISYRALNQRANQVAHYLLARGIGPEVMVGVCTERSIWTVLAILAIWKVGAVYVALDPTYPVLHLARILDEARVAMVLTQSQLLERLPKQTAATTCLDRDEEMLTRYPFDNLVSRATLDNLSHVLYTSGSTGEPKGVVVPQRQLLNRFTWLWGALPFDAEDIACQRTTVNFSPSLWELLGPLIQGVPTVILLDSVVKDPLHLATVLEEQQVTRLLLVPSILRLLLDSGLDFAHRLPRLRCWILAGEPFLHDVYRRLRTCRPGDAICVDYGATEMHGVAWFDTREYRAARERIPIGRPIANTHLYVLNERLQPAPIGVTGEIHVESHGLARGYLNHPDMTAESFLPHPWSATPGMRLYKTGDLGRWLPDGTLEYLGRRDNQVKVRGYRVELGGVEAVLQMEPQVKQAAVAAHTDSTGERVLIGYIVPRPDTILDLGRVRAFLQDWLPEYMIPSAFVTLEALPLMPNGKIDRRALPAPDASSVESTSQEGPRTPVEEILAEIWCQILHRNRVGIYDNFFNLGGHSLLATQVVNRIRLAFQIELTLQQFFSAPHLAGLALLIEQALIADIAGTTERDEVPSVPSKGGSGADNGPEQN